MNSAPQGDFMTVRKLQKPEGERYHGYEKRAARKMKERGKSARAAGEDEIPEHLDELKGGE